jgi:cupin superfamily acireductone dioxygenase involved in methionine salvage
MVEVPEELSSYFKEADFSNYPKVSIPQSFVDERGEIINIADGTLGDVAIINSMYRSVRANHIHETDWHLSYCLIGSLNYSFLGQDGHVKTTQINAGELFFTPNQIAHRMDFLENTVLVVISRNSRKKDHYEEDTKKFNLPIE